MDISIFRFFQLIKLRSSRSHTISNGQEADGDDHYGREGYKRSLYRMQERNGVPSSELLPKERIMEYHIAVDRKYGIGTADGLRTYIHDILRSSRIDVSGK